MTFPESADLERNPALPRDYPFDPKKMAESVRKCDEIALEIVRLKQELENLMEGAEKQKQRFLAEKRSFEETEQRIIVRIFDIVDETQNRKEFSDEYADYLASRLRDVLGREGIECFTVPKGTRFDPERHTSVRETCDNALPEDHIVEVVQCGYMKKGKILRKAGVVKTSGGSSKK